jgi:hypothetical protein
MTPYWNAAARGVIIGFSGSTRRGDLYCALPPRPKEATEAPQELVIFGAAPKPDSGIAPPRRGAGAYNSHDLSAHAPDRGKLV